MSQSIHEKLISELEQKFSQSAAAATPDDAQKFEAVIRNLKSVAGTNDFNTAFGQASTVIEEINDKQNAPAEPELNVTPSDTALSQEQDNKNSDVSEENDQEEKPEQEQDSVTADEQKKAPSNDGIEEGPALHQPVRIASNKLMGAGMKLDDTNSVTFDSVLDEYRTQQTKQLKSTRWWDGLRSGGIVGGGTAMTGVAGAMGLSGLYGWEGAKIAMTGGAAIPLIMLGIAAYGVARLVRHRKRERDFKTNKKMMERLERRAFEKDLLHEYDADAERAFNAQNNAKAGDVWYSDKDLAFHKEMIANTFAYLQESDTNDTSKDAVLKDIEKYCNDPDPRIREFAVKGSAAFLLSGHATDRNKAVLADTLVDKMKDHDLNVRTAALEGTKAYLDSDHALPEHQQALLDHGPKTDGPDLGQKASVTHSRAMEVLSSDTLLETLREERARYKGEALERHNRAYSINNGIKMVSKITTLGIGVPTFVWTASVAIPQLALAAFAVSAVVLLVTGVRGRMMQKSAGKEPKLGAFDLLEERIQQKDRMAERAVNPVLDSQAEIKPWRQQPGVPGVR